MKSLISTLLATFFICNMSIVLAAPAHIEVVIFAIKNPPITDDEWHSKPAEEIRVEIIEPLAFELNNNETYSEGDPNPVPATSLIQFAKKIEKHSNYELLEHFSWIQEPEPKSKTKTVKLDVEHPSSTSIDTRYQLEGEASVYEVAQLLFFEIDVTYKPNLDQLEESVYHSQLISLYTPSVEYQMTERRRVLINETHYFDHPKFGVVFNIKRPAN